MVTATSPAWTVAAAVPDPEVPVLTIEDLGILRDVRDEDGRVTVVLTPTYSGCPAMDAIRQDVELALTAAGYDEVDVRFALAPAWTTDWMSADGRRKLAEFGIAPPTGRAPRGPVPVTLSLRPPPPVTCPQCGSPDTHEVSRFGSAPCRALYACRSCLEAFDHFKVH
jgi:ring-1,2-phenylacetyl-CoA epoxidase subunit PaaD